MGITRFIFYNLMGWKIQGDFDSEIKKAVVLIIHQLVSLYNPLVLKTP